MIVTLQIESKSRCLWVSKTLWIFYQVKGHALYCPTNNITILSYPEKKPHVFNSYVWGFLIAQRRIFLQFFCTQAVDWSSGNPHRFCLTQLDWVQWKSQQESSGMIIGTQSTTQSSNQTHHHHTNSQLIELPLSSFVLYNESLRSILFARNVGHPDGIRLVGQGAASLWELRKAPRRQKAKPWKGFEVNDGRVWLHF